ncbi:MAG: nuclease A inhibitor family protein [Hymenobacter sp.]
MSYAAPTGTLTDAQLLPVLGEPAGTPVAKVELTDFLSNHTADNGVTGSVATANRFKALQLYLKQELDGTQVYRVGKDSPNPRLCPGPRRGRPAGGLQDDCDPDLKPGTSRL